MSKKTGERVMNPTYSIFEFEPREEDVEKALYGQPPTLDAEAKAEIQKSVRMELERESGIAR